MGPERLIQALKEPLRAAKALSTGEASGPFGFNFAPVVSDYSKVRALSFRRLLVINTSVASGSPHEGCFPREGSTVA